MTAEDVVRVRVRVRGTVQGVGFRPFVHRRATALRLSGWVGNDGGGVLLELEGPAAAVRTALDDLRNDAPVLAVVEEVETADVPVLGSRGFAIVATDGRGGADAQISADVAPCPACLREMRDPQDRRCGYPFVNCTDCGPRYTIVRDVPYDRPATTMAGFAMCARCRSEYEDPEDRRFHAQPIACPQCGPQLDWCAAEGRCAGAAALTAAVACLAAGGVVAVKGIGGYHLACDATSASAVAALRLRKHRPCKPFAVMVADLQAAEQLCELQDADRDVLLSPRRPIVLLPSRRAQPVAAGVAPGLPELGLMLPSSPLHELLLQEVGRPLVMTSGNRAAEPVLHLDADAREQLRAVADGFLSHDRPIHVGVDDSVLRSRPGLRPQMVRRARGWVPQPVRLPVAAVRPVLAVGAQLKSTVALVRGRSAVLSQHLGDLDSWPVSLRFEQVVRHLVHVSGVQPALVVHDLHPDYRSTRWAEACDLPLLGVQHHHAHVASCLAEHGVSEQVLGIAFDGMGLGTDGTLWGGEFLLAGLTASTRVGHLAPVALPGGDAAAREPWRTGLAWLEASVGRDAALEAAADWDPRCAAVLSLAASGRSPVTTSVGRLFDAVAAVLHLRLRSTYEAQAAIELEARARAGEPLRVAPYPFEVGASTIDPRPMFTALLADRSRAAPVEVMAARFHVGLAEAAAALATRLCAEHAVGTVALTGGAFSNVLLSRLLARRLEAAGLRVLQHRDVPPNDGGIALGQAAVAAALTAG